MEADIFTSIDDVNNLEFFMKNIKKLIGIIALMAVIVTFGACVTNTTMGGTADIHGAFSANKKAEVLTAGATEIASYKVVLGLVDSGYEQYNAAVNEALASGKQVFTVTKVLFFSTRITAYVK